MRIRREGNRQTRRVPSRERERLLCAAVLARLGVVLVRDRDGVAKVTNFAPVPVLAFEKRPLEIPADAIEARESTRAERSCGYAGRTLAVGATLSLP